MNEANLTSNQQQGQVRYEKDEYEEIKIRRYARRQGKQNIGNKDK